MLRLLTLFTCLALAVGAWAQTPSQHQEAQGNSPLSAASKFILTFLDCDGKYLSDNQKINPGGFVPLNDDNDDYQFNGNAPVMDLQKTTETKGENDLVPLVIHPRDDKLAFTPDDKFSLTMDVIFSGDSSPATARGMLLGCGALLPKQTQLRGSQPLSSRTQNWTALMSIRLHTT